MIRVNEDYVIEIDSFNYTVKRDLHRTTVKVDPITLKETEVDSYRVVGYFCKLPGAIKGVIEDMNKRELSSGVHELEEAISIVLENNKKVSDLLERVLEV